MPSHVKASMTLDIYVDLFDQEDPEAFSAAGNGLSSIYYGRLPRCGGITASDCGQLPNREPPVRSTDLSNGSQRSYVLPYDR